MHKEVHVETENRCLSKSIYMMCWLIQYINMSRLKDGHMSVETCAYM